MSSQFKGYLGRTVDRLRSGTTQATAMDGRIEYAPFTMYSFSSFTSPFEPPSIMAIGADSDIGGLSTAKTTAVPTASFYEDPPEPKLPLNTTSYLPGPAQSPEMTLAGSAESSSSTSVAGPSKPASSSVLRFRDPKQKRITGSHMSHLAFHGNLSLRLPPAAMGKIRTGYVGMRNRFRPTVLGGEDTWDVRQFTHIRMQVAYRGWEGWRKRWYCNIQSAGPIPTDVWQLRLDLPASASSSPSRAPLDPYSGPPPRWTTLHLPLSSFVLTNLGSTSATQLGVMMEAIRSVGFSLLGGGRDNEGLPAGPSNQNLQGAKRHSVEDMELPQRPSDLNLFGCEQEAPNRRKVSKPKGSVKVDGENLRGEGVPGGMDGVTVTPWSEGYYELCVRYVQAVKYNPMLDDRPSEWDEWETDERDGVGHANLKG